MDNNAMVVWSTPHESIHVHFVNGAGSVKIRTILDEIYIIWCDNPYLELEPFRARIKNICQDDQYRLGEVRLNAGRAETVAPSALTISTIIHIPSCLY